MLLRGLASLATHAVQAGPARRPDAPRAAPDRSGPSTSPAWPSRCPRPWPGCSARASGGSRTKSSTSATPAGFTAPPTRFNNKIGPHRRSRSPRCRSTTSRRSRPPSGVTVNDVVLGMCSGRAAHLPREEGRAPRGVAALHDPRVGPQPTTRPTPTATRCRACWPRWPPTSPTRSPACRSSTRTPPGPRRRSARSRPTCSPSSPTSRRRPSPLGHHGSWPARTLANRINPPFNVIISNVPGPQFPLYAAGAEMLHYYPVSAVADTQGLNITIQSYNGNCDFGLVACRDAGPRPVGPVPHARRRPRRAQGSRRRLIAGAGSHAGEDGGGRRDQQQRRPSRTTARRVVDARKCLASAARLPVRRRRRSPIMATPASGDQDPSQGGDQPLAIDRAGRGRARTRRSRRPWSSSNRVRPPSTGPDGPGRRARPSTRRLARGSRKLDRDVVLRRRHEGW